MTVREFYEKVKEEFAEEIALIVKASEEEREDGNWKADIGVAADIFIDFIDKSEGRHIFVNVDKAKAKIAEWRAQIVE